MDSYIREDDFLDLQRKFCSTGRTYFNPAHAVEDEVNDCQIFLETDTRSYKSYNNDSTGSGIKAREKIKNILFYCDNIEINLSNITITPSITTSSLLVMKALKELGVSRIWLETPCYYATIFQAKSLDIKVDFIPTFKDMDFEWKIPDAKKGDVVWLTQPRISLCKNQSKSRLQKLVSASREEGFYIVLDEATELELPSLASEIISNQMDNVIRLKGIYKPLCINGPRISYILHGPAFGDELKKWIWTFFGGIDNYSINSLPSNEEEIVIYASLLKGTHERVRRNFDLLSTSILGSRYSLPIYENGYTTCISTILSAKGIIKEFEAERSLLIKDLMNQQIFPTLGASMYFAYDAKHEFIRINLLTDVLKLSKLLAL